MAVSEHRSDRYKSDEPSFAATMEGFLNIMRLTATLLGIIAIVTGLVYATRLFGLILHALQEPGGFDAMLTGWSAALGGDELSMVLDGHPLRLDRILAVVVLGGGTFLLVWLALGVMLTGAKIISWTAGDRDAVRRVLAHVFGAQRVAQGNVLARLPGQTKPHDGDAAGS